jgi:hypothetical protein
LSISDSPPDGTPYYKDSFPAYIRKGRLDLAENYLKDNFSHKLADCVARWGQLPIQLVQIKCYEPLVTQARCLYIDGYFEATVALCGMAVEALCISLAERVQDETLRKDLLNPNNVKIRCKVNSLEKYYRIDATKVLLHDVLDIRKDYLHLHKKITPEAALECLFKLHFAVFGEYGLVYDDKGGVRYSTKTDVDQMAKDIEI